MKYKIGQDSEYTHKDYWAWSAWIEADDEALDAVDYVTWILHPTFSPSRVRKDNRANRFKLSTSGWGTFRLRAVIESKTEGKIEISKYLKLKYPETADAADAAASPREDAETSFETSPAAAFETMSPPARGIERLSSRKPVAPSPKVKIFVSYGTEDTKAVQLLRKRLAKGGVEVLDAKTGLTDEPVQDAVRRMIRQSDVVLGFIGHDYVSPWVATELAWARSENKHVLALTNKGERPFGLPAGVPSISLDEEPGEMNLLARLNSLGVDS